MEEKASVYGLRSRRCTFHLHSVLATKNIAYLLCCCRARHAGYAHNQSYVYGRRGSSARSVIAHADCL